MRPKEIDGIGTALGGTVVTTRTMAGGFSHETCLLTLADGRAVVARLGGPDPAVEAAVMAAAREHVPVPEVLHVLPPAGEDTRPAMVVEYVAGTPLSRVLTKAAAPRRPGDTDPAADADEADEADLRELGAEVGRVVAHIGAVAFERPGFFADRHLTARAERPWSAQLPEFAETCMATTTRLDPKTRRAWVALCAEHAPALTRADGYARLVHADVNPKNILVSRAPGGWRVSAVLDWEFAYSGCPYGDAANMARFRADYPRGFLDGFQEAFAAHRPDGLPLAGDWAYLGDVLDMFALSDLVTRPDGHPVADQAAERIRSWVADGPPRH
jgi:aminoglycoside phosphotransferase (APT) family kinase protein